MAKKYKFSIIAYRGSRVLLTKSAGTNPKAKSLKKEMEKKMTGISRVKIVKN